MSQGAPERQEIPTHLEVEDRVLFGLTLRQGIIALVGLSLGYSLYAQLGQLSWPAGDTVGHLPLVVRIVLGLLPALVAVALATIQPAGRPLEEWLFALARYAALPKECAWRPRVTAGTPECETDLSESTARANHWESTEVACVKPLPATTRGDDRANVAPSPRDRGREEA